MKVKCYNFKKLEYNQATFADSVDTTYILHLEGNGRLPDILDQLNKYHPTKTVYIVFNKGYKKCEKKLSKNEPPIDLIDAYYQVLKDAKNKNYRNILILEDDFIFNERMNDPKVTNDINTFINDKDNEEFMYMLGALPHLQLPYKNKHYTLCISTGTHASIYSKKLRDNIIDNVPVDTMNDWDLYTNLNCSRYIYEEPLCYQLFPDTENSKYWINHFGVSTALRSYIKSLELDTKAEPGYSNCYTNSRKRIYYILIFIIIIVFFYINKL